MKTISQFEYKSTVDVTICEWNNIFKLPSVLIPGLAADNLSSWSSITKQHEMDLPDHSEHWVAFCVPAHSTVLTLCHPSTEERKIQIIIARSRYFEDFYSKKRHGFQPNANIHAK